MKKQIFCLALVIAFLVGVLGFPAVQAKKTAKPTRPTLQAMSNNRIKVTYRQATYSNRTEIQFKEVGAKKWKNKNVSHKKAAKPQNRSTTLTGLKPDKDYQVRIRAVTRKGKNSPKTLRSNWSEIRTIKRTTSVEKLTTKQKNQVKQSFLELLMSNPNWPEMKIGDIKIRKYYGTYNKSIVTMMDANGMVYLQVIGKETIAGVTFNYNNSNFIRVWNNGTFYRLQEAYEKGFLSVDDLKNIAYYQN